MDVSVACIVLLIMLMDPLIIINAENTNVYSKSQCTPANYAEEGSGYCTERIEGWFRGGAWDMGASFNNLNTCYKSGSGGCKCRDCGDAHQSCQENRCHDDDGYLKWNAATREEECLTVGTNRKRGGDENWFDFCYASSKTCDLSRCTKGQYLSGCKRASAGTCVSCPVAQVIGNTFWGAVGNGIASCALMQCAVPKPGEYIKTACTTTTDAVIKSCAEYPGNKGSSKDLSKEQQAAIAAGQAGVFDIDRFYCPAGNLVLPLPANSVAINKYTAFECKAGFYLSEGVCLQCPAGCTCVYGRKFTCPSNYYSKYIGSSACDLCTSSCKSKNRKPLRCNEGSTNDGGCVSCGACNVDADAGLTCVENNYEMQQLAAKCSPSSAGEWLCKQKQ